MDNKPIGISKVAPKQPAQQKKPSKLDETPVREKRVVKEVITLRNDSSENPIPPKGFMSQRVRVDEDVLPPIQEKRHQISMFEDIDLDGVQSK